MASVKKTTNGQWRARWRTPDGESRSRNFARKVDAENHLTAISHSQLVGTYVDPRLGKTRFRDVVATYLDRGAWRPKTAATAQRCMKGPLETFGSRPVASIRRGEVQAFLNRLELAPSTVKLHHQHLVGAFECAVEDRLIITNPARGVNLPRQTTKQVQPMSKSEIASLIDSASPTFRVAVVLGVGLGLRLGEAAGLTVDRCDFLRRTVRVDRQWQQIRGTMSGAFVDPKTKSSARTIPASQAVLDVIAAHLATYGRGSSGTIVHSNGAPLAAPVWQYEMRKACKAAGVDGVTFHDLRHQYASALISAGCSVKAVQTALGHASAAMTLDTYSHLWPGDDDRIRAAGDALFASPRVTGVSLVAK